MSQIKLADVKRKRGLWPFMGLLLAVALGILSYYLAPTVIQLTRQLLPQFSTRGIPGDQLRLIFTALTFVVLLLVTALLVALFMPKKTMLVKESDLKKEREQMVAYKKADKLRQRKINLQTQQYLKEKGKRGE
jgi:hypothetical protein